MKKITTIIRDRIADTDTPTGLYLKLRDHFPTLLLLESNDHHNKENATSYLCFEPLLILKVLNRKLHFSGLIDQVIPLYLHEDLAGEIEQIQEQLKAAISAEFHSVSGLFGFTAFEAAQYFDDGIAAHPESSRQIPEMHYAFHRFVIEFNHYHHTLKIIEHLPEGEVSRLTEIEQLLDNPNVSAFPFQATGPESSNLTDEVYQSLVTKGKEHCARGDVFQLVLSRKFQQPYSGDPFTVYRTLRSINPSPYLFYFDYGDYAIFGSSPEAQLQVSRGKAQIHPIAGTFPRTGDETTDRAAAQALAADPKENAEHVMLVDLARNDLNRNTIDVQVKKYKTTEYYSHVMHLVSVVEGQTISETDSFNVFANTFPAGTLSGAPKIKALELIGRYEEQPREFYGGAIGFLLLNGDLNHAIIIRSVLAKDNLLHYQAGAGIVIDSDEQKECDEVAHKLGAIKKAIQQAHHLKS